MMKRRNNSTDLWENNDEKWAEGKKEKCFAKEGQVLARKGGEKEEQYLPPMVDDRKIQGGKPSKCRKRAVSGATKHMIGQ